jgi:iron complex outermembrane receptor protein
MSIPFVSRRAGVLAMAASLAFPAAVLASEPNREIASVVVTANRFATSGLDEPVAIQIIDAEMIRDSAATTVGEVLQRLGGVHTRISLTGLPDAQIDLRGFGMSGDQNTLVLVDGQRLSENELAAARISAVALETIERIEILRGAGAVLYGGGATAGTINIITRGAGGTPGSYVEARAGSFNLGELATRYATRVDGIGIALDAQHRQTDNFRRHNAVEQDAARAEVRWQGGSGFLSLALAGDDQEVELPGPRRASELASDPRGSSTLDDHFAGRERSALLRGEFSSGELRFAVDTRWRNKRTDFHNDFGFGYVSDQSVEVDSLSVAPRVRWATQVGGHANQLTAGIDWSDWDYANATRTSFGDRDERGTQTQRALYLRNELALTPDLRLTLGGRRERISLIQSETLTPLPEVAAVHHLNASEVALQQRLSREQSLYLRFGRSFRVANIDENRCYFTPCAPLLRPQRSRDSEIGWQWQQAGARLRASLFNIDLDDELHYNALEYVNMNLAPTRRRGAEVDAAQSFGALEINTRLARTQARFRSGNYGGIEVSGNEVPLVPRWRAGVGAGWQFAALTRLNLQLDYVGAQRYDNDQANRFQRMPGYTIAALKLSHRAGPWLLVAGIENLFDRAYYSYAIVNGAATSFNAYPEAGRNAYISARYSFQ